MMRVLTGGWLGKEETMTSLQQVEDQLKRVGCNFRFWCRPEVRELCKILMPGETIAQAVVGRYENGAALLCATDHRLLLIDKKPMFLTLEDIRFDMISEIDYNAQLFGGTVRIMTPNRKLTFSAWNQARLRNVLNYTQLRVSEIRQHYMQRQFEPQQQMQVAMQPSFPPQPRDDQYSAPAVGGLALQGNAAPMAPTLPLPFNPYTNQSVILRHRRIPKFY
jgi:hypothetical protein